MPGRSSSDILDAELTRRVEEQARVADTLVALEGHPGHRLLAAASLIGVTAARWIAVQELLASAHADLAAHRAVVAAACAVRTRRRRPGGREWTELHELLAAPAPGTTLTLGDLTARVDAGLREVAHVLETAEAVHLAALAGLGPPAERVRDARTAARDLLPPGDPDVAALDALAAAVDARLAACTNDPLSRPTPRPRDLADGLGGDLDRIEDRLTELAAAQAGWADRRRAVADAVAALDPLWEWADRARRAALDRVTGPVAVPPDPRPALRRRLGALPARRPGADALAALPGLERDVAAAGRAGPAPPPLATHQHVRRAGHARRGAPAPPKALRVGVSDDPQVVALTTEIRGLLDGPRADLAALTRALLAYQDQVSGERTA